MTVDAVVEAGSLAPVEVLRHLDVGETGLTSAQVRERLARFGPNAVLCVVTVGALLSASPLAGTLGFAPLSAAYFAALAGMVAGYIVLVEVAKRIFYRATGPIAVPKLPTAQRHQRRRAARFSSAQTGTRPRRARPPTTPVNAAATASTRP